MRKNQRPLKLATLLCLDVLVSNYGRKEVGAITDAQFATIVQELPALITEGDLHVSQVGLTRTTCSRAWVNTCEPRTKCPKLLRSFVSLVFSQLTLSLLTTILAVNRESLTSLVTPPGRGSPGQAVLLAPIMMLVRSPLLQGGALNSLLDFLKALVTLNPAIHG